MAAAALPPGRLLVLVPRVRALQLGGLLEAIVSGERRVMLGVGEPGDCGGGLALGLVLRGGMVDRPPLFPTRPHGARGLV